MKRKALISLAVTAQLICSFDFAQTIGGKQMHVKDHFQYNLLFFAAKTLKIIGTANVSSKCI